MADDRLIQGGVVHDLPGDLEEALRLNPEALRDLGRHYAARAQRVDLLDSIPKEAGNQTQAHRLGLLESEGWQAPSLLLAWMPSSLKFAKDNGLGSAFHPFQTRGATPDR